MHNNSGFTLIELVTVIILLGILSVSATSLFIGNQGFNEYAVRDQIKSSFRFAQQRAMYDSDNCYRFFANAAGFGPQTDASGSFEFFGPTASSDGSSAITFTGDYAGLATNPGVIAIAFDNLGNPRATDCSGALLGSNATIEVTGGTSVQLTVFTTGYVE